jgi:hypothetical protein
MFVVSVSVGFFSQSLIPQILGSAANWTCTIQRNILYDCQHAAVQPGLPAFEICGPSSSACLDLRCTCTACFNQSFSLPDSNYFYCPLNMDQTCCARLNTGGSICPNPGDCTPLSETRTSVRYFILGCLTEKPLMFVLSVCYTRANLEAGMMVINIGFMYLSRFKVPFDSVWLLSPLLISPFLDVLIPVGFEVLTFFGYSLCCKKTNCHNCCRSTDAEGPPDETDLLHAASSSAHKGASSSSSSSSDEQVPVTITPYTQMPTS